MHVMCAYVHACMDVCFVILPLNGSFPSLIPHSKNCILYETKKRIVIYLLSKKHVIYFVF